METEQILIQHGITTKVENGVLFAWDAWTERINNEVILSGQWVNASNWTNKQLFDWLGY